MKAESQVDFLKIREFLNFDLGHSISSCFCFRKNNDRNLNIYYPAHTISETEFITIPNRRILLISKNYY